MVILSIQEFISLIGEPSNWTMAFRERDFISLENKVKIPIGKLTFIKANLDGMQEITIFSAITKCSELFPDDITIKNAAFLQTVFIGDLFEGEKYTFLSGTRAFQAMPVAVVSSQGQEYLILELTKDCHYLFEVVEGHARHLELIKIVGH